MHTTRFTSLLGTANGIDILDLPDLDASPDTYPDGYTAAELGLDTYEDNTPPTLRSPSFGNYPVAPSFSHWPEEETCAPSSGGLCSVHC